MELSESEFGAEDTTIKEEIDDLAVLEQVGFWLCEGGDEVGNFVLIISCEYEGLGGCSGVHMKVIFSVQNEWKSE